MHKIAVIGVGPGGENYLTGKAMEIISQADVVLGGKRHLETFAPQGKDSFTIANNLAEMVSYIKANRERNIVILATGDPGLYGILTYLKKHFEAKDLLVIPGISSFQEAFARLAMPWQDAILLSTHGREPAAVAATIKEHGKAAVLTGPNATPSMLAAMLEQMGLGEKTVHLCCNLTLATEWVKTYSVKELANDSAGKEHNCVMVIVNE